MQASFRRKISWFDWLVYRLFYWRWGKILSENPDLREYLISWLKAYDALDEGERVRISVHIEKEE